MITKKPSLKFLVTIAAMLAVFLFGQYIGGTLHQFVKAGLVAMAIQLVVGFIAAAVTLTPVGTAPSISVRNIMLRVGIVCLIGALILGGLAEAAGVLIGVDCGLRYHRSVL